MAVSRQTDLTLEDLFEFPDDGLRRELLGGRLYVSPQPRVRHQRAVRAITVAFDRWASVNGGEVLPGCNVDPARGEHVEPDVVFIGPGFRGSINDLSVLGPPDLAVEVLSPSNKRYDLVTKRDWYERQGVSEYWAADLDTDEIIVFRLDETGRYGQPQRFGRGQTFTSSQLPGAKFAVDELLPA